MRLPKRPESYWRCEKCEQPLRKDGGDGYCPRRKWPKGHKPVLYQPPDDRPLWVRVAEMTAHTLGGLIAVVLLTVMIVLVLLLWIVVGMAIEGDGPRCSFMTVSENC